jgi:catechol 2,3-dioxygenase-like lactoylglutathione lyase family enzyme
MEVRNIRWVGVPARNYEAMVAFVRQVLGLELETAGIEVIGATGRDTEWEWIHFRAPDGNLYELASRLPGSG